MAYETAVARASLEISRKISLTAAACPGFVEFVERNETSGDAVTQLAEKLLAPIKDADVDALLLGCTHYPYLSEVIARVMGAAVKIINSADSTATVVHEALLQNEIARPSEPSRKSAHDFYSSGDVEHFAKLGQRFLGPELVVAQRWPK